MRNPCKVWLLLSLIALPLMGGCADANKTRMLGIIGYNYTDRYIDSFSVGGQGGGNVYLSDHESGGGGTSCCIGLRLGTPVPVKMRVQWTFGYKRDAEGNIVMPDETHETTAELRAPIPDDPQQLEVHFMPDGTVQLRVTYDYSPPLLIIDRKEKRSPR